VSESLFGEHGTDEMQIFTRGLRMHALAEGTIKNKNEDEVRKLVENMSMKKYRSNNERWCPKLKGRIDVDTHIALLAQVELLNKHLAAKTLAEANVSHVQEFICDLCGWWYTKR
jgi:hypothetical protein